MRQELENRLKQALEGRLPGEEAQFRMAPKHRTRSINESELRKLRPSAVMILLCEHLDGSLFFPLIERPLYKGAHSGQISLPGGKYEEKDGDLARTAERECFEEIGISGIQTIGKLTPLHIPVSGFLVHPFIGFCKEKAPHFLPQEREVKTILRLNPEELIDELITEKGEIHISDQFKLEAPWFNVQGHKVWGATAMILSELAAVWKQIN